ncbi:MAG: heat-inducible transcription repressor HrcA [Armatimonadetes bacterium]|nr:heat-inducible transcription repressor HrcA [Armatimonadota bacterium]
MEELTERKQRILRAVVIEYVETAEPVGSGLLVERYTFGVSPATVRNELSEMSERGFLEQPHTSAGRIPSDTGYRYFVDRLSERSVQSDAAKQVRDLSRNEATLHQLLAETCRVLSRLTSQVSIAATLGERSISVKSVSVTGVTKERALVAAVFSNGSIETRIIPATPDLTLADIHDVSLALTAAACEVKIGPIARMASPEFGELKPAARILGAAAWKSLKSICRSLSTGKVITEGTQYLFSQPEFKGDVDALGKIISALGSEETLHEALDKPYDKGATVTIGHENSPDALHRLAIIASRFYSGQEEAGAIGIAGPTRMRYSDTIPLVETAAKALSEALSRLMR